MSAIQLDVNEVQASGGLYKMKFVNPTGVEVKINRIQEGSRGDLTGEIQVQYDGFAEDGKTWRTYRYRDRLNLLSGPTRASRAKDLHATIPGKSVEAWRDLVEFVAVKVIDKHREGEPVIDLSEDQEEIEELPYRLYPILEDGQASVLYGDGGVGKSLMAMHLGYLLVTGREHLGLKPERGNVLLLDYETDPRATKHHLGKISAGFGTRIPAGFMYRRMTSLLAHDFERINELVVQHDIDLLIVDSALPASGEPESSGPTGEYFAALRALSCTTVTVAHVAKTQDGKLPDRPFGSQTWRNQPRANYQCYQERIPGGFIFAMKQTKTNNGATIDNLGFTFRFEPGRTLISHGDPSAVETLADSQNQKDKLLSQLNGTLLSTSELADVTGLSAANVRVVMNRLRKTGSVDKDGDKWLKCA